MEEVTIDINIGDSRRTNRVGDFINAVDELFLWFHDNTENTDTELAEAIKMYSEQAMRLTT